MMTDGNRKQSLVWGLLLIVFGAAALLENFFGLRVEAWAGIFAGAGLLVLLVYLTDRSSAWPLIPAYVMLAISGLLAVVAWDLLRDEAIATYVLAAVAVPFIIVFLRDRGQWWALIPAYVMLVVAAIVFFAEGRGFPDYLVGTFVLFSIGLPFLAIYLRDRAHWWALIPAYVMLSIGLIIPLAEMNLNGNYVAAYVMFAVALPFWVVYVRDREQWWALIPGGIMTVIGASLLLAEQLFRYLLPVAIIAAGLWILVRQFIGSPADDHRDAQSNQDGEDQA
jgi:hypothetical protein